MSFKKSHQRMIDDLTRLRDELADEIKSNVTDETPVNTGHLKESWKMDKPGSFGETATISNEAGYAAIVNDGDAKRQPTHFIERSLNSVRRSK